MFKETKVQNRTSGNNKVTCKFYERLANILGHRAVSNTMITGVDSSGNINGDFAEENCVNIENSSIEDMGTSEENVKI